MLRVVIPNLRLSRFRWTSTTKILRKSYSSDISPTGKTKVNLNQDDTSSKKIGLAHIPKHEYNNPNDLRLDFDIIATVKKDVDPDFKKILDKAMKTIYDNKVNSTFNDKIKEEIESATWSRLQGYIYEQLNDPKLNEKIQKYVPSLLQTFKPSNPDNLIPQLVKCNELQEINSDDVWEIIYPNLHGRIDLTNKLYFILDSHFDYIYNQEILPAHPSSYTNIESINNVNANNKVNISNPIEWFPEARKMRRNIIMHLGPTNSGKTYRALQRLKQVDRGYYAGPLRLLAREVYDRFQNEGVRCNLLTGEEVIQDLNDMGNPAGLTSGTIEMVPLNQKFDVVVLDEIQMMSDMDRGWAWTNALLGVRAREVHLCGEKSTLEIVKKFVEMTGDKLIINEYDRLGELEIENKPLGKNFKDLRKGDCIVAFSKKKILDLKLKIEHDTNFKVAVIYGSLPPETRLQQANIFNKGEADIMVASDAIGMGLNLSIDRVIFTTDLKFNGTEMMPLTSSNIKQIGGRAGRFKPKNDGTDEIPKGYITSLDSRVLKSIKKGIEAPIEYIEQAVIWPTDELCAELRNQYPADTKLSTLLNIIAESIEGQDLINNKKRNLFKLSNLKTKLNAIKKIEHIDDIPFLDKLRLSNAPVKDLPLVNLAYVKFCETIATKQTRSLLTYPFPFEMLDYRCIVGDKYELEIYESLYNIITLFFWLSNRYPNYFIDIESANELKTFCELIIFEKLDRLKKNPYSKGPPVSMSSINYKRRQVQKERYR